MKFLFNLLFIILCFSCSFNYKNKPPNIIVIISDDQGYADVGFHGSKEIFTPNIDRIANNGVVFSQGYVSFAVCSPSRAGLITGRYQNRFGYTRNILLAPKDSTMGLPLSEQTLPEVLKKGGVLVYPTDTLYGFGCDAKNEKAINTINTIKNRFLDEINGLWKIVIPHQIIFQNLLCLSLK